MWRGLEDLGRALPRTEGGVKFEGMNGAAEMGPRGGRARSRFGMCPVQPSGWVDRQSPSPAALALLRPPPLTFLGPSMTVKGTAVSGNLGGGGFSLLQRTKI